MNTDKKGFTPEERQKYIEELKASIKEQKQILAIGESVTVMDMLQPIEVSAVSFRYSASQSSREE